MRKSQLSLKLLHSIAGGALIAASLAASGAVHAETLADSLADAYENSGLIERNRAVLRAADEDVAIAVSALRPTLNYALTSGYVGGTGAVERFTNSVTLSTDLTLYDFGRNRLAVEVQKETVLATREVLVSIEQQALGAAVNSFFDVIADLENISLRENNVRLIAEELRAAQDRFEVGEVTITDVALAESRLAAAQSSLAGAEGDLSISRAAFAESVGRAPGDLIRPASTPALPASVSEAKAIALANHPDIKGVQRQIAAAELNLERSRRAVNPSVTASGSTSFDIERDVGRVDTLSLTLGGPIYQGGSINALARQAQTQVDTSRADLHLALNTIEEAVEVSYARLAVARASIVATNERIRAAEVAFEGTREEAALGARTTLDVLTAEQELLDARASLVSAVAAEYQAAYAVLSSIGRLTARDLGLNVQLYDPAGYYNLVKNAPTAATSSDQGEALDRVLESLGRN